MAATMNDVGDIQTPDDVAVLVRRFYASVIPDPLLGPIFEAAHVDWTTHIPLLCSFWERQLLGIEGYSGNAVRAHVELHDESPFGAEAFERWLSLFDETVDEHFFGPVADHAKERARQVAIVLQAALARPPQLRIVS
jgi:truncated hemoglobin YjbI